MATPLTIMSPAVVRGLARTCPTSGGDATWGAISYLCVCGVHLVTCGIECYCTCESGS